MDEFQAFNLNPNANQRKIEMESSSSSESSLASDEDGSLDEEEETNELQNFKMNDAAGDIASLIALNQTYLDLIERLVKKVENLLENSREEQKRIKEYMGNKKPGTLLNPIYRTVFFPPYFKDTSNMIPLLNEESREIRRVCNVNVLTKEEKPWSIDELKLLKKAVVVQLLETKNKDIVNRRDYLRNHIVNYKAEDGMDQLGSWKEELMTVNRRLNYLNSQDDAFALKSASFEAIDWARIAVREFKGNRSIMQVKVKWLFEQAPHWNKSDWAEIEDEALKFAGKSSWQNWDFVASKLDTNRTAFMCFERSHFLNKKLNSKRAWTTREDEQLLSLVDKFTVESNIGWKKVAAHMPDRNKTQCETRYNRSLNPSLVHGRWTDEEDMLLIASVNKYGPHDWPRIAQMIPGRTDVQCRARWVDYLDYKRSKAPWSREEDETILVGIQVFGRSNFSSIAKLIPGRNTSAVKIRVRSLFRWKIRTACNKELSGDEPTSLGQIMESSRVKPEAAIRRFNQLMEMSKKLTKNQHGFSLAQRLGYGNFVLDNEEQNSDYSAIKQQLNDNFGKWFISKNGRWVRLGKNPNEFGENELRLVMDELPEEKRQVLRQFLNERTTREALLKTEIIVDDQQNQEMEQSNRIAKLIDEVLVVEQKDINAFHKKHHTSRFDPTSFSFKKSDDKVKNKRTYSRKQKMNANFSSLIHDLAPKRYTIADRLTDEITYRINKLPMEERRGFILNLMSDMLVQNMDSGVQLRLGAMPKPVHNVKVLNYLHTVLSSTNLARNTNNDEPCTSSSLQDGPTTSSNDQESALRRTLQNLIIPSNANCNMIFHYKNIIRSILMDRAKLLFPVMDTNCQPTNNTMESQSFADIQLTNEVTTDSSYQLLKERMTRLFLLPMLLKRALESDPIRKTRTSVRESHDELKALQQAELTKTDVRVEGQFLAGKDTLEPSTSSNDQVVNSFNETSKYRIYNPLSRNQFQYDSPTFGNDYTSVPPSKRRRMSQMRSVSPQESNTVILKTELINGPNALPSTSQQTQSNNTMSASRNINAHVVHLPYKPRRTRFTPTNNTTPDQSVSVRDFILMNQKPSMNYGTVRKPRK